MKLTHSTCQAAHDAELKSWAKTLNRKPEQIKLTSDGKVLCEGVQVGNWK